MDIDVIRLDIKRCQNSCYYKEGNKQGCNTGESFNTSFFIWDSCNHQLNGSNGPTIYKIINSGMKYAYNMEMIQSR